MEIYFLLFILVFILIAYLVFKLIKKIFLAVFTILFILILIFASTGALVYFDVKSISEKRDFNINLIYGDKENPNFALSLPMKNSSVEIENIMSKDINSINEEDLSNKEGDFYIYISEKSYRNLIDNQSFYSVEGLETVEFQGFLINLSLSGEQLLTLLDSSEPNAILAKTISENNDFPPVIADILLPFIEEEIEREMKEMNLNINEILFVVSLYESVNNQENLITILEDYKKGEIEVYPNRFSFRLLKLLPVSVIANNIEI
jgi:hypothetical protein